MVSLSIHRKEGEPSWKIQFIGDSPENLTIEDIPNLTLVKWKMDLPRSKASSIQPYKMILQNGQSSCETIVSFRTNAQEFIRSMVISAPLH